MAVTPPTPTPELVKVKLIRAHTDNGILRKPGEEMTVPAAAVSWLVDRGIIAQPPTSAATTATKEAQS